MCYTLTELSAETGVPIAELAERFADVTVLDAIGRPSLDRDHAARFLREHADSMAAAAAREEAHRQRHRAELAKLGDPHARTRAIRARQALLRAEGRIDANAGALDVVMAGDELARQERAGRRYDTLLAQENLRPGQAVVAGYSVGPIRLPKRKD